MCRISCKKIASLVLSIMVIAQLMPVVSAAGDFGSPLVKAIGY